MKQPGLYACVYVREFPAQALLRFRPELKDRACVVMDGEPPFEKACSLNTKARLLGIQHDMSRTDIDGFRQAMTLSRSLKTESTVKELMLECAAAYSPRVEDCSGETYFLCAIDIAGTESLFGASEVLARRLLRHVHSLGLSARIRVSENFYTATCLAKASSGRAVEVVRPGEEAASLSQLPLHVLSLTAEQSEIFASWGIYTLAMLAALPEKQLIARIGQDGRRLQQLARGELPHLFQPVEPAFRLEERLALDFPLDSLDSLMFGVAVMLDQLILRAVARLVALAAITIVLELDGGGEHTRRVRPARPGNDKQFWVRLLHLDLQAHPPLAAIIAITLHAEPRDINKVQLDLFSPPLPEPARMDLTLAQLEVLLGDGNVGHASLQDSHTPESFRLEPFRVQSGGTTFNNAQKKSTAMRQLRPPEITLVHLTHSRPVEFFFVDNASQWSTRMALGSQGANGGTRCSGIWSSGTWWREHTMTPCFVAV